MRTQTRFHIHHDSQGSGPPILALSGLGCSNWIFEELAADLATSGTWIMPDNRGMGRSSPAREPYEIADLARDALDLMDALGHARFTVVGISMGGFIAQEICRSAPERVRALVLMCTTGPGEDFVPLPDLGNDLIEASYSLDRAVMVRANTEATVYPGLANRDPARYRAIFDKKFAHLADLSQLLLQNEAAIRFVGGTMDYTRFRFPTLVLAGEGDRFVDVRNAHLLAEKIPEARAVVVPETDHLFFLEKPRIVAAEIERFLEAL